ncbi:MAG: DNA polymerase III subunit delta' [Chloroflexi bacterium]|nr:DNA polymerase III subunit delta' [Chloroflexota bacterium]
MWQTKGHEQVVRGLRHSLSSGRLAHAYLLVGPPQVGKGMLALDLARAVNCEGGSPDPCGRCRSCQRIAAGKHADVVVLHWGEGKTEIGIDQVREVQHRASLKPVEGRCRVFIVDGAEDLSVEAANCLLKTLEEPAPQVLFLLLTCYEDRLLPTVRSRCQRLAIRPLPLELVVGELQCRGLDPERAALIARLARGRLGWALLAAEEPQVWQRRAEALGRVSSLAGASTGERFSYASGWAGTSPHRRERVQEEMDLWEDWWRDLFLVRGDCSAHIVNRDYEEQLRQQAQGLALGDVVAFLQELRRTRRALEANASPRLALEALMLHLPCPERLG